LNQGMAFVY